MVSDGIEKISRGLHHGERVKRKPIGGLGAKPRVGSRGNAPGGGSGGFKADGILLLKCTNFMSERGGLIHITIIRVSNGDNGERLY
jgi:hypothetical protein